MITKTSIEQALTDFIRENKREPTILEIDKDPRFPSARTIQRSYGGIKKLRQELGLKTINFSAGDTRRKTAYEIGKRSEQNESDMYKFLLSNYEPMAVHRQYMYTDDRRCTSDFAVWNRIPNHRDVIDVFYPKDETNFVGCVNSKQRKHNSLQEHYVSGTFTVWFVCLNEDITQDTIDKIINNKKNTMMEYQRVVSYDTFKEIFKK